MHVPIVFVGEIFETSHGNSRSVNFSFTRWRMVKRREGEEEREERREGEGREKDVLVYRIYVTQHRQCQTSHRGVSPLWFDPIQSNPIRNPRKTISFRLAPCYFLFSLEIEENLPAQYKIPQRRLILDTELGKVLNGRSADLQSLIINVSAD